jgi:hypothetical protein
MYSLKWVEPRSEMRVLDFDLENRPLSYWFDGNTTAEITAIAVSWNGVPTVDVRVIYPDANDGVRDMLVWFCALYDHADMVTGHYIRRHDLPIINAACLELGLPLLGAKLTSDTQQDLVKRKDLSASQESLAAMYGLPEAKHHMSQDEWRRANRLTPEGIEATIERAKSDVIQHKALRERLIEAGALKPPKMWTP